MDKPTFLGAALEVDVRRVSLPWLVIPSLFAGPPYLIEFYLFTRIVAHGWECTIV